MSAIVGARLLSNILRKINYRRFSVTFNPPKEPIVPSSSVLNKQAPPPPTKPPPPQLTDGTEMKPWDFLKYGLIAALTGGLATAGYATYVPAKLLELYIDLRRSTEEQVRGFTEPSSDKLLPDLHPMEQHVFTLVLDLNET